MSCKARSRLAAAFLFVRAIAFGASAQATDLSTAPPDELLKVYTQLRSLQGSDQGAVTENVVWRRDAGTFTFRNGRITFAAPVAGRVVAASFIGEGIFELNPPTDIDRHQIARFAKGPKLEDGFREAVFFFTDDSGDELQKLVNARAGGDAGAAGKAIADAEGKYQRSFNSWWENRAKGYFPIANLAARMLADLSDPSSRGFFLADIRSEHHDELFYHVSWNRDEILNPGFSTDEEVMLMHNRRGQYSEWWSGFHLAGEYAGNPHPEHRSLLAHCRDEHINADVSKDNHLSATAEMQFQVPAAKARVLPINLDGVLRISAVTDEAGNKIDFIQEDRKLDNDTWVILPEPATAGKIYKLKFTYEEDSTRESRIIFQQGTGLYFVRARESWYPSFGAFDDRTHFFLHFSSPKNHTFVATGRKVGSEKSGKTLETDWESEIPYSVVGFNYGDLVSKSKSDSSLTVTAYTGEQLPDILAPIANTGVFGSISTAAMAGYTADLSFQAFKLFQYYFGPLPFKSISVSEQPVMGFGQSWPTLIFLSFDTVLDPTIRHELGLDRSPEAREFYNTVAIHEMSHQWWGHKVGWKTYHDQWLSEGFADFSSALTLKNSDPKKFKAYWDLKRKHLLSNNRNGHRPVDVGPLWLNYQTNAYLEEQNSTILIYEKGACVLEMLRTLMEDPKAPDPDARFIAMMQDYVSTYAGKNASTQDFKRIVEKHFGEPMDWFFNDWVYGTETPHYDLRYEIKNGDKGQTILSLSVTQSDVSDSFFMRVPVYVTLQGASHRLGFVSLKGSTTFKQDIRLGFRPEKVTLDDTHSILCTIKQ